MTIFSIGNAQVKGFVQLSNVYYAGSHGMDIMVPPKPLKPCDAKNHATASVLDKVSAPARMHIFLLTSFAKIRELFLFTSNDMQYVDLVGE